MLWPFVAIGAMSSCKRDISRSDALVAVAKEFGGQYLVPITLTGPAGIPCSDLPSHADKNFYIRGLIQLVEGGQFQLVDSAFVSDSTGYSGTHCAAVLTEKGRQHSWHEQFWIDEGKPSRQATVEVGPIHIEVTGIVEPEPGDSTTFRHVEWRKWQILNDLGRAMKVEVETTQWEGTLRRYDDGWRLLPEWKRTY
jgi:hypothetical protein